MHKKQTNNIKPLLICQFYVSAGVPKLDAGGWVGYHDYVITNHSESDFLKHNSTCTILYICTVQ